MAALPDAKIDIVRSLVSGAPDKVVSGLRSALAAAGGDTALAGVRRVVEAEVAERNLRNRVLEPVAPLFVGAGNDAERLTFAAAALPLLWRGLRATAPAQVSGAALLLIDYQPGITNTRLFDDLVERLADEIDAREQRDIVAGLELIESARPGGVRLLRSCLAIAPVVRHATVKLPDWISRTTQEHAAAARVSYRDACRWGEDVGPRFFEMLAAQLAEPWTILRIVSQVMDHPSESYLSGSELAMFPLRLMEEVDVNLRAVADFDLNGGEPAGLAAAAVVETLTLQVAQLEDAIDLAREGGWGRRIHKQKQMLASVVEGRLRELAKVQNAALPSHKVRISGLSVVEPNLQAAPDERQVERLRSLLNFAEGIRPSAAYGGFSSTRAKVMENAAATLDQYVESVLSLVRDYEVADREIAARYLRIAAEFAGLIHDRRAAETVRRRAGAAFGAVAPQPPAWEDPARRC